MTRVLAVLVSALALAALSPAEAMGWIALRVAGSPTLSYQAGVAETNDVTISLASDTYTITDVGATAESLVPTPCTRVDDSTITCPAAGITHVDVFTTDLDDRVVLNVDTPASIFGGGGDDDLTGGGGNDTVIGDGILGELGSDRVAGGGGDDEVFGKSADVGTDAPNQLDGGPGRDDLWGAANADVLAGGTGDDTLRGFEGNDSGNGGEGGDFVTGGDGNDFFDGGPGDDTLGSAAIFMLVVPEWGDDRFDGGAGDDVIRPGPGPPGGTSDSDSLNGGEGRDVVTYAQRVEDLAIFQDGEPNDGGVNERDNVGFDVERVEGGASDDRIVGSAGVNEIDGGQGADVLEGADGADTLDGGAADAESDTLRGGGGPDLLRGNAGDDALDGGPDADDLQGGEGDDGIEGGEDADSVSGGPGIDDLRGGQGADALHGEDGRDTLGGDAGDDELRGGAGDDVLSGGRDADLLGGGADTDTADYGIAARGLTVSLDGAANDGQRGERDNVQADIENVVGAGLEDTFTGSRDPNRLDGGAGEDYLDGRGGAGDDVIGGSAIDVLRLRDNGRRDEARCGSGSDFVIADRADRVSPNCERRDNGVGNVPELGSEVVAQPVRGGNEFGLPDMHRTVPLEDRINLPVGSKFDTRGGAAVRIVAARAPDAGSPRAIASARTAGVFSGGRFTVVQRRSRDPVTELRLRGGDFRSCRRSGGRRATAAQRRRALRRLRGRSGPGYRTRGRRSSATVRGTAWEVVDRCDGTLTRVFEGVVEVFDFGRRRTITVRAGQSYLARAP